MPVTPFHFGPGLLLKGVVPRWCSWTAFVASNVVIDIESAYYLMHGEWPVHRRLHTFVGAGLVGVGVALLLIAARRVLPKLRARIGAELAPVGIVVGAMAGALTHPVLDGIMHDDIEPLRPWSANNPLHLVISVAALHEACLGAALLGAVLLFLRRRIETARSA